MPTVSNSQILAIIVVGGFFLLGGVATVRSLLALTRGYASRHWPQTIGMIIESRVEERVYADGQLGFCPQVRYRYVVGDKEYESSNIRFPTKGFSSGLRATIFVAQYPVNSSIIVSYLFTKPHVRFGTRSLAMPLSMGGVWVPFWQCRWGCYFSLV
jgi:hypothetical protein